MIPLEKQRWDDMLSSLYAKDLWSVLHAAIPSFAYHHNMFTNYSARLDRWYLLYAQQFAKFSHNLFIDHCQIMLLCGCI